MNNLRSVRKSDPRKLTQQDVADWLGIERSTYGKYETGHSEPTFDTLCRLADYFNVSVEYLMGRTDIKKTPISKETDVSGVWAEAQRLLENAPPDKAQEAMKVLRVLLSPEEREE